MIMVLDLLVFLFKQILQDIPENLSLDAQDNLQQQSNDETKTHDQQNMEPQRGVEKKGRDIRFRLEQVFVYISLGLYAYLSFMFILLYNIHRHQRSSLTFYSFIIDNGRRSSSSRHNNNNKRWNSNKNKNLLNSNSSRQLLISISIR